MQRSREPEEPKDPSRPEQIRRNPRVQPAVDILERAEEIVIRADMPGIEPSGIDVRFERGILSFSGRVKSARPEGGVDLLQELDRADYYREFAVGEEIERSGIFAEYEMGVLTLHLPRTGTVKARRIDVRRKPRDRGEDR
jgi:HSP20 family protein